MHRILFASCRSQQHNPVGMGSLAPTWRTFATNIPCTLTPRGLFSGFICVDNRNIGGPKEVVGVVSYRTEVVPYLTGCRTGAVCLQLPCRCDDELRTSFRVVKYVSATLCDTVDIVFSIASGWTEQSQWKIPFLSSRPRLCQPCLAGESHW
ncbi:hypothetical protein HPP92_003293 [Vanilla planifolia]|uniref:Uncharacterized protein n=1 Tax=Vanilla planifolia TaxID=51239 RepID=A0A835SBJ2_VANPL|nr:hypothetical protein HPP92_003293 [Vanilla planifolia]